MDYLNIFKNHINKIKIFNILSHMIHVLFIIYYIHKNLKGEMHGFRLNILGNLEVEQIVNLCI